MTKFWVSPAIDVLSKPDFSPVSALPMNNLGVSSPGEQLIEYAGRLCYMSQSNASNKTTAEYIDNIMKQGHGSVLEHCNFSLLIQGVSRALTHELTRHRAGTAISQLSQRYVDASDTDFVIPPVLLESGNSGLVEEFKAQCLAAQASYAKLSETIAVNTDNKVLQRKRRREAARSVLANAAETKLVWTANVRALRHVITLRGNEGADLEMIRFSKALLAVVAPLAPACFADITASEFVEPAYLKV